MISNKRIFVNKDKSKIVEEGSEEAAFLLVGEGAEISDEDIEKYELKKGKDYEDETEEEIANDSESESDVESKAVESAPENKAVTNAPETKTASKKAAKKSK